MAKDRKEEKRKYYQAHKEEIKTKKKAYYQTHKEVIRAKNKAWNESHKEEKIERDKAYNKAHKDKLNEYTKDYQRKHRNSLGKTKNCVRALSNHFLKKYGKKIPGYEIHHCCTYDEPYKFIYCSKEMHKLIHSYLRQHNISADSNHYDLIKHILDETVVLYGIE